MRLGLFDEFVELMGLASDRAADRADAAPHRSPLHSPDRLRPDHHRPGVRVRLLGNAGSQSAATRGVPRGARELQPGHDHDRPRVRRRHLHRADHPRGGRGDHRPGEARRPPSDDRRPDRPQRDDATSPRRGARPLRRRVDRSRDRSHRTSRGSGPLQAGDGRSRSRGPEGRLRPFDGGGDEDGRGDRIPGDGPPVIHPGRRRDRDRPRPRRPSSRSPERVSTPPRSARSSSRSRYMAGRNSNSR